MKRIAAFCITALLALSLLLAGCGGAKNTAITCLLTQEPVTLDPQIAKDSAAKTVVNALFEGLTRLNENGAPIPGAAQRWDVSPDGKTYTFHLREDAKWSDDVPLKAQDFVFAFRRALDPATGSTTCETMLCIENAASVHSGKAPVETLGVTALDDRTLVVRLAYENRNFPALTATTPYMPCREDFFHETAGKYGLDSNQVLGNGPFVMENRYSWEHGEYINLLRSGTYGGESDVVPYKLTFPIDESDGIGNMADLLRSGETDGAQITPGSDTTKLTVTRFTDVTWGLLANTKSPSLKKTATRKLFFQCLDRQKVLSVLPNNLLPADDILPPTTRFNGQNYRQIAGSGFYLKEDQNAVRNANTEQIPTITILCPDTTVGKAVANEVLTLWNNALGHYYNMEPLPQDELENRIRTGNYEIALTSVTAGGSEPTSLLSRFRSDNPENPAFLSSKAYDKLLSREETDSYSVVSHCREAERYLNETGIFYPLWYETREYAAPETLSNVVFYPDDIGPDFRFAQRK